MTILAYILAILVVCSWCFWVTAIVCARIFFRYERTPNPRQPGVSILKPVRGVDAEAYENFVTFCRQDYPEFEILFGTSDPEDPCIAAIERLQRNFPNLNISLHFCPRIGMNDKSSVLHQLVERARYPILAASDSDIRVTPDYLSRVAAPLADEKIGLVTCLYRSQVKGHLPAKLEALYLNASFTPAAIVGAHTPHTIFGFGAAMAMRKSDLQKFGGYAAIVNYVSDDFHLASQIARLGLTIKLSEYVVTNLVYAKSWRDQLLREIRWARMIRTSNEWGYRSLVLTFSTPLSLLLVLVAHFAPWSLAMLGISLAWRWIFAFYFLANFQALTADVYLLPLRDCMYAYVWAMGLMGRHISWRGRVMNILRDGRAAPRRPGILKRLWVAIDAYLRRKQGVREFTDSPLCLLRYSVIRADRDLTLADGTRIASGDEILDLHFWNEHLPLGEDNQVSAAILRHQMQISLAQLAEFLANEASLRHIRAIRGRTVFVPRRGIPQLRRIVESYHFQIDDPRRTLGQRIHDFFENVHILGLLLAFNPKRSLTRRFRRQRHELWISRSALMTYYVESTPTQHLSPAKAAS